MSAMSSAARACRRSSSACSPTRSEPTRGRESTLSQNNGRPSQGGGGGGSEALAVAVILDKSGSMGPVRAAVVEGYNEYLADLGKDAADTYVSLTMFDTGFQQVFVAEPLAQAPPLDVEAYRPGGGT